MENKTKYTKEGLKKLQDEYDYLTKVWREENRQAIATAKGFGDLSENAEYAAAKEDQTRGESRILELEELLKNAELIDEDEMNAAVIGLARFAKVTDENGNEKVFYIVSSNEVDPLAGKISEKSPIGLALVGHKAGQTVEVNLPNGKKINLTVNEVGKTNQEG